MSRQNWHALNGAPKLLPWYWASCLAHQNIFECKKREEGGETTSIRRLPLVMQVQVCQATYRDMQIHCKSSETKHNELKRSGQNLEACWTLKLVCRSQLNCLVVRVKTFWQATDIVACSKTISWLWQHPPAYLGKLEVIAAWGELSGIATLPEAAQKPSGMTQAHVGHMIEPMRKSRE